MGFEMLDLILEHFVKRHGLELYKKSKDDWQIRSLDLPSKSEISKKEHWEIWLDEPNESGATKVHVINYSDKSSHQTFPATPETLDEVLERCLAIYKQSTD